MEMDSAQLLGDVDSNYNDISEHSSPPEVLCRVGDEYQIEVPSPMRKADYLRLQRPSESEFEDSALYDSQFRLAIPVIWVTQNAAKIKNDSPVSIKNSDGVPQKVNSIGRECTRGTLLDFRQDVVEPTFKMIKNASNGGLAPSKQESKSQTHKKDGSEYLCPLPGSASGSWSNNEEAGFLLGLYIFDKDFCRVQGFVESKKMEHILSYYYGKFYKSESYHRWSECRKTQSRKCIYGRKIFTGLRRQELLSRLCPRVSEECQKTLLEISKSFAEGKMVLEEYVFTLKAAVGLNMLVEAVGVGKGRQDLTGIPQEPLKPSLIGPSRPELPAGKTFSALTTAEIISFLTGNYRLSKAWSNDLFWEAVWPRLLARGWQSELPNDRVYAAGLRNSLVFLTPGIKKFSRKKLVKGNQYFDSINDVLRKVASDPQLLELEIEADKGYRDKKQNGWTNDSEVDQDNTSDERHHNFKPRNSSRSTKGIKVMIVDTSMADRGAFKMRELRSLPLDVMKPVDGSNSVETGCLHEDRTHASHPKETTIDVGEPAKKKSKNKASHCFNGQRTWTPGDKRPRKAVTGKGSWTTKPENANRLPPLTEKRRRLNACNHTERSHTAIKSSFDARLKLAESNIGSETSNVSENRLSDVDSPNKESSSGSTGKDGPVNCGEAINNLSGARDPPQPRLLIDLNLPYPSDAESEEPYMMLMTENQQDETEGLPDDPGTVKNTDFAMSNSELHLDMSTVKSTEVTIPKFELHLDMNRVSNTEVAVPNSGFHLDMNPVKNTDVAASNSELHFDMNMQRQSRRNHPPTVKALEALASGFLGTKLISKSEDSSSLRPSHCTRASVGITENSGVGGKDSNVGVGEREDCAFKKNDDMVGNLQISRKNDPRSSSSSSKNPGPHYN